MGGGELASTQCVTGVAVFVTYCGGVLWSERNSTWQWWQAAAFSAVIMIGATSVVTSLHTLSRAAHSRAARENGRSA